MILMLKTHKSDIIYSNTFTSIQEYKMQKNIVAEIRFVLLGSCLVYDSFCRKCPESITLAVTLVCISEKIHRYKIPLRSYTNSFSGKLFL